EPIPSQRSIDEKPRIVDTSVQAALSMTMFAIGLLFHSTSPLLTLFVCIFFVVSYYSTRAVYLDAEDRTPSSNPAAEATLSQDLAQTQIRYMLLLHTLAVYGTFFVLNIKLLWGGAAFCAAALVV